jgi:hypothetical protein
VELVIIVLFPVYDLLVSDRGRTFALNWQNDLSALQAGKLEPAAATETHPAPGEGEDIELFLKELRRSKKELDIARFQFENAVDPMLIDHVVFRLGAAERHFNYLFQIARRYHLAVEGMRWEWYEDD